MESISLRGDDVVAAHASEYRYFIFKPVATLNENGGSAAAATSTKRNINHILTSHTTFIASHAHHYRPNQLLCAGDARVDHHVYNKRIDAMATKNLEFKRLGTSQS